MLARAAATKGAGEAMGLDDVPARFSSLTGGMGEGGEESKVHVRASERRKRDSKKESLREKKA